MDQPMRWVCLWLDAHNFVAGPAPRADEISRSHVQPPAPRQPASSLPCCEAKFTPEIWDWAIRGRRFLRRPSRRAPPRGGNRLLCIEPRVARLQLACEPATIFLYATAIWR